MSFFEVIQISGVPLTTNFISRRLDAAVWVKILGTWNIFLEEIKYAPFNNNNITL